MQEKKVRSSTAKSSSSASVPAFASLGKHFAELGVVHVFFRVVDADVSGMFLFSGGMT